MTREHFLPATIIHNRLAFLAGGRREKLGKTIVEHPAPDRSSRRLLCPGRTRIATFVRGVEFYE